MSDSNIVPPKPIIAGSARESLKLLKLLHKERLRQAYISFRIALVALILGLILVFLGVIFTLAIGFSVGTLTGASSVIIEVISALAFYFYKDTNDRLDKMSEVMRMLDTINDIKDQEKQDAVLADLAKIFSTRWQRTI